jgi:uroporphyrinogen-III synthase
LIDPGEEEKRAFLKWFSSIETDGELLITAFSVPGVHSLKSFLDRNGKEVPFARWAVTGELTEQSVKHTFPGHEVIYISPDGTGRTLAELLIKNRSSLPEKILAVSAVEHQDDFFAITGESGISLAHMRLYRLNKRAPGESELDELPVGSRIVFASPSAANSFFDAFDGYAKKYPEKRDSLLFCVIGPTTKRAVLSRGYPVYAVSTIPDLERFTEELL